MRPSSMQKGTPRPEEEAAEVTGGAREGAPNVQKGTPRPEEEAAEVTGGGREDHKAPQERKKEIWGSTAGGGGPPKEPKEP